MKDLNFEQLLFIKKEYNFMSNNCKKYFDSKSETDIHNLHDEMLLLVSFIYAIEGLFNCNFYRDILPKLNK